MYKHSITYLTLLLFSILCSCSTATEEGILAGDKEDLSQWIPGPVEEFEDGTLVRQTPFKAGDVATRSSFEFDGSKLVFQWEIGDELGIYSTASQRILGKGTRASEEENNPNPIENPNDNVQVCYDGLIIPDPDDPKTLHPNYDEGWCLTDPDRQSQVRYVCTETKNGAQTARIFSTGNGGFDWEEANRWTAYFHFKNDFGNLAEYKYNALPFDFKNQTQTGFVNMTAWYNRSTGDNLALYRKSEFEACRHIGKADVMISPEMAFDRSKRLCFEMRHLGAVARFFLVVPKDKAYKLTKLQLICESAIFYESGEFSLKSHTFHEGEENYGLNLDYRGTEGSQIKPTGEKSKMLELAFDPEKVKIDKEASDGDCLIAYLMMYPVDYQKSEYGNLYAYVTAIDPETSQEVHFVTEPLADKNMVSGNYYQWTTFANPGDGLYPIELTATLLPWQDIVGGNINTDLTK